MNIQSHHIEIYNQVFDISASRVLANSIRSVFGPIEKKWHDKVFNDFYKTFENLDDVYENATELAQEVLLETVDAALGILAKNSIYDVDDKNFAEEYLSKYEFWDDHFDMIASQYEAIIEETAQKDAYRTQRRLNRSKLVGFGPAPSLDNGYRSAQSYANFSNTVDNIGHGIFNLMAKGVTAIGNSIKKDEIFKSQATVDAVDSAVRSIVLASRDALIDALNERCDGAIHIYSNEEIKRANSVLSNVESGRVPESDIQKHILSLFSIYPYDERIYTILLSKCGADNGKLDVVAKFFGISTLADEKRQLFEGIRKGVDLSSLEAIKQNASSLIAAAERIGYSDFLTELEQLQQEASLQAFAERISSLSIKSVKDFDGAAIELNSYADTLQLADRETAIQEARARVASMEFKAHADSMGIQSASELQAKSQGLKEYATRIGFKDYEVWLQDATERVARSDASRAIAIAETAAANKKKKKQKVAGGALVVALLFVAGMEGYIYLDKKGAFSGQATKSSQELASPVAAPIPAASQAIEPPRSEVAEPSASAAQVTQEIKRRPLSPAALEAIQEGFVDIADPTVKQCTEAKIQAFKKENGTEAVISFQMNNEFAVDCGFNI